MLKCPDVTCPSAHRHSLPQNALLPDILIRKSIVLRKTASALHIQLAKSRQASECSRSNGSEEVLDSTRSRDSSHRDLTHLDEPGCSENLQIIDDGNATRRNRSVTSSRISLFFGKEKTEMLNRLNAFRDARQRQSTKLEIEDSWRAIVDPILMQNLSRKAADQQEAIWEIVNTEYNYISLLRTMDELSCCLTDVQRYNFLKDVDSNRVFINYSALFQANVNFWNRAIHPMLSEARKKHCPLDPTFLFAGFDDIHEWSRCYINFHLHHDEAHAYVSKKAKEHELFREFLTWAESHDGMKRQKLLDMLKCPMQRITRYSLLLKAVLRMSMHSEEQQLLQSMVERAESATHQLNFEMNNNDLRLQLHEVMKSIEGADYVDGEEFEKAFKNRCIPNLAHPMALRGGPARFRRVHMRAELKVKEGKTGAKVDMHCIIFTDMLLMCKNPNKKGDKLRIARPPIHISKIYYQPFFEQPCGFYMMIMSDFDVPAALYLMYTANMDETKRFLEMLGSAREEFYLLQKEDSPVDEFYRNAFDSPTHSISSIIHRKSSSMDSQVVAAAHAHLHHMRKTGTISSTEQLDRGMGLSGDWTNRGATPTHKLSVVSCHAAPISQSKSSVDLHLGINGARAASPEQTRHRSRSNSSGPELPDGNERNERSRSPSPTPATRTSRLDTPRGTPRNSSPQPASPEERTAGSPALLVTSTEEDDQQPSGSGRRFEKRYHTADGIDVLKPKGGPMPTGILKRFSWNVSTAMGASSRKISSKYQERDHSRRHSQSSTTESFGSSTSGICSSTGSYLDSVKDEEGKSHVSTICIGEDSCETLSTLNGSLDSPLQSLPEYPAESSSSFSSNGIMNGHSTHRSTPPIVCTPPVTDDVPPVLQAPPIVHEPMPMKSLISPPPPPPPTQPPQQTCASQKMAMIGPEHQLLKFIMDNKLETSDV
ncbi:unnamed protein product, partial [Mesorhabditis belari]|uniref:DH domain-containing protein n=1 Tax=Mesorhabditis belari TaxID=2138241 RepID=A0AAF3F0Z8_9BILA